jgi:predicted alpha/beta superfamily hydrolase
MKCILRAVALFVFVSSPAAAQTGKGAGIDATPLTIGETFTMQSATLGEARRINVYAPPGYAGSTDMRLPVLYMPDGGIREDFLHVAGLIQVSVGNGTMRPFLLVGIENTQRRRDLTGPTANARDSTIAPNVGGSAAFRSFLRSELMPLIDARYRTTAETGIVGESLAGLFVVETFFLEPDLFDTYIAFDPSLWWNDAHLVSSVVERLRSDAHLVSSAAKRVGSDAHRGRTLYLASSGEPELAELTGRLAGLLEQHAGAGVVWEYHAMPDETHATIYHPAALRAFRELFALQPD